MNISPTLLLNASYEPLTIIPWRKALRLILLGKAETLESYPAQPLRSDASAVPVPAVLRLRRRVVWQRSAIRFSRQNVYLRDRFTCQYCQERPTKAELTFDHVLPRARGGRTCWENIVTCCFTCNQRKGDRTPAEAGLHLQRPPFAPRWLPIEGAIERNPQSEEVDQLWQPYLWT